MDQEHVEFYRERDLKNRLPNKEEKGEPAPKVGKDGNVIKADATRDLPLELAMSLLKSWDVFSTVAK